MGRRLAHTMIYLVEFFKTPFFLLIFYSQNDSMRLIVLNWESRANQCMSAEAVMWLKTSKWRTIKISISLYAWPTLLFKKGALQAHCMYHSLHIMLLLLFTDNTSALFSLSPPFVLFHPFLCHPDPFSNTPTLSPLHWSHLSSHLS